MTDKILEYMEKYHMLPENGNIVVGVSGGADSVCLLYTLVKLRSALKSGQRVSGTAYAPVPGGGREPRSCETPGLRIRAVHVNHGLRQEAEADADFVKELCEKWDVPFVLVEEDVEELARTSHLSCEETGRLVRYRAFAHALMEMDENACGAGSRTRGCIAVAHNSDDRAETLLFHLLRGTGLSGMGSIRPVRENADGSRIIRPLLFMSRQEIEAFLQKEGLSWRTDHTNAQELYTRNKIRNRILPYAEAQICGQAKAHLAREAALLAETAEFVEKRTQEALGRCAAFFPEKGELRFFVDAFWQEEPFLQKQMLKSAVGQVGCQRDLTAAHVAEVNKLFAKACTSGRKIVLPGLRIRARRQFGQVILSRIPDEDQSFREPEVTTAHTAEAESGTRRMEIPVIPGIFYVPGLGNVRARLLAGPANRAESDGDGTAEKPEGIGIMQKADRSVDFTAFLKNIPEKKYTKWLDYDKIIESAIFRTRRTGDYLTINDALGKKSLKRYMIEEKIPAHERDDTVLLADGAHVIWVVGYRISAAYKVTAETATILEVCCDPAWTDHRVDEQ